MFNINLILIELQISITASTIIDLKFVYNYN